MVNARLQNRMRCFLAGLLIACFSGLPADDARGEGRPFEHAVLLVLQRNAPFYQVQENKIHPTRELRRGTAVAGIRRETIHIDAESQRCWRVHPADGASPAGWVYADAVEPFDVVAAGLKARAAALRASKEPEAASLPELIRLQDNASIKKAWQDIDAAITENEQLQESDRLPEPYFARAEIWASVNNYSASLQDYLTALKYARHSERDLMSYSAYFDRLYAVIDNFQKVPAPPLGGSDNYTLVARQHYMSGYHTFWDDEFKTALDHFDNAIQLDPDNPLYWYYRALTFKRMGDSPRAQCDALFAAYLERARPYRRRGEFGHAFSRVQGDLRQWLESCRLGDPSHRLLRSAIEGIPVLEPSP